MKDGQTPLFNALLTVFVVSIVVSNVVGARVITTGLSLFGVELATSGGAITYAFTFLCTDVAGELYGKEAATRMVRYGFIGQLFALGMVVATGWCPAVDGRIDAAYRALLGQSWSFVLGSLCAYYASQTWDVWIFHRLRDWHIRRRGGEYRGEGRWLWNNLSTCTSQVIDTLIYASISFGLGMGWFFDPARLPAFIGLCAGQYALKFCLALLDTPFFYLLTRRGGGARQTGHQWRKVCTE